MKLTIDASVHLSALSSKEEGSADSRALLRRLHGDFAGNPKCEVYSPTLLAVEVSAAASHAAGDETLAIELADALRRLPCQTLIPMSELLAEETSRLAAKHRLHVADAVYGAVAQLYGSVLVTRDPKQRAGLSPAVTVWSPAEALDQLSAAASGSPAGG